MEEEKKLWGFVVNIGVIIIILYLNYKIQYFVELKSSQWSSIETVVKHFLLSAPTMVISTSLLLFDYRVFKSYKYEENSEDWKFDRKKFLKFIFIMLALLLLGEIIIILVNKFSGDNVGKNLHNALLIINVVMLYVSSSLVKRI